MDYACAILAGGESTRMGQDKATLKAGETTLIRAVFEKVSRVFNDIMVISSVHERFEGVNAPVYRDILPVKVTMTGIVSALIYSKKPYVFIVGCDMPFLSEDAIQYVLKEADSGQAIVIPKVKLGLEPLHAVYSRSCLSPFLRLMDRECFRIPDVLPFVSVKKLKEGPVFFVDGRSVFTNVNTPRDLEMVAAV